MIAATALKIIVDRFPPNTQSGRCAVSPSRLGLQPPSRLKTCFRTLLQGSHLAYSCYSSGLPCPLSSLLRAPSAYFLFLITHSLLIITFIFLSLFGLFLLRVSCHHHLMAYIYTLFFSTTPVCFSGEYSPSLPHYHLSPPTVHLQLHTKRPRQTQLECLTSPAIPASPVPPRSSSRQTACTNND